MKSYRLNITRLQDSKSYSFLAEKFQFTLVEKDTDDKTGYAHFKSVGPLDLEEVFTYMLATSKHSTGDSQ